MFEVITDSPTPIISFKDFTFQYRAQKRPTLYNINLDIYPGERVLIAGPSGSGKSTLSNCINGLVPFSYAGECTGSLTINGIEASKAGIFELSHTVGTVLQDPDGQFIGLTVAEDIAFSLENDCVPQERMHDITQKVAATVGVEQHLEKAPHELSGGQKQRVSLAGVMVDDVKVLLFDEPLANLDPATGKQVIELIDEIQQKSNTTVLIIEHRLEDVLWRNVDRIVLIAEGRIIANTTPDRLLAGNLLEENGIREPLYITALKYAGVPVTEAIQPAHINTINLDTAACRSVQEWFTSQPERQPAEEKTPLLEVRDVSFGYDKGQKTLEHISFSIARGEMVSIIGRNGAGKSTLAKLICGFEKPDSGQLMLDGRDITGDSIRERAKRIGYVMQNPNQMISKTMIYDEVAL
ncbi:MAG: ABC transporter ATP-binding protein, partial [Treponemataceae bacterium]|nr:ABC transporter ATP-binding protein [Treponemataceae bacterium]